MRGFKFTSIVFLTLTIYEGQIITQIDEIINKCFRNPKD